MFQKRKSIQKWPNVPRVFLTMNEIITADYAHKIDQRIKNLRYSIDSGFLDLAKSLKEVRDEKLYKLLNMETFEAYIAQPELAFERRSVYAFIQIYETFVEKYNVHPDALLEAGWTKLSKIIPYTNDKNHDQLLEKATSLSRSDLDEELVEQGYITKKEQETQYVECPFCHKVFHPTKRAEETFKKEDYTKVIQKYEEIKETKFEGKEYDPIMQSIKTMFLNGRTPEQIMATMEFMAEQDEYSWTIRTIQNKIAEILPQLDLPKEASAEDKRLLKGVGIQWTGTKRKTN